MVFRLLSD